MSFIYGIQNGNIAEGVLYQVITGSILYNSTTYSQGDYFTGVKDVTA